MEIVLHVGMNKTASTTLQMDVFPRLADLQPLGFKHPGEDPDSPLSLAVKQITPDGYEQGLLRKRLRERACELPLLLSEERYTSTLWHDSWEQMERTADRLASELPGARIVIVIRHPADLLVSSYAQYVREGGTLTWRGFLRRADLRTYDVTAVSRLYAERFPSVHVLRYEDLRDPDLFAAQLVGALGSAADPRAVAGWLGAHNRNWSVSPLFGYFELVVNKAIRVSRFNPAPWMPSLNRFHYDPIGRRLRWANRVLGAKSWRLSRRIARRRREAAKWATQGFSYPPP